MEMNVNKPTVAILASIMAVSLFMGAAFAVTEEVSTTASVSVGEFLSVTLNNAPVSYPSMNPGDGPISASVGNGFPLTATIGAESNVNAAVSTKAVSANFCTDYPTCSGDTFTVDNMEWSVASAGTYTDYSTVDASVCSSVSPGNDCEIYHRLSIPGGQNSGTYSTDVTITATSI